MQNGIEETYVNTKKAMSDKPTAHVTCNNGKLKTYSLGSGTGQGYPL